METHHMSKMATMRIKSYISLWVRTKNQHFTLHCVWMVITYCFLAVCMHSYINPGQSCLADIIRHETVGVAVFWHGQNSSS